MHDNPNTNPAITWNMPQPPKRHTHYVWEDDEDCPLGWVAVCRHCSNGPLTGDEEERGTCYRCDELMAGDPFAPSSPVADASNLDMAVGFVGWAERETAANRALDDGDIGTYEVDSTGGEVTVAAAPVDRGAGDSELSGAPPRTPEQWAEWGRWDGGDAGPQSVDHGIVDHVEQVWHEINRLSNQITGTDSNVIRGWLDGTVRPALFPLGAPDDADHQGKEGA